MSVLRAMGRVVVAAVLMGPLLAGAAGSWGCSREYSQATPDDVLRSARAMVEHGDVHRLPDLIYAESKEMRQLLGQVGRVLTSLQLLAVELNRTFPDEVEQIRAEAAEAAARGDSSGLLGRMIGGQLGSAGQRGRRGGARGGGSDARQSFDQSMKELFADPYGWLERSEGRISTQYVADDMSAVLWDGKPAFGVGLLMKQERGKWYLMLPSALPGLGRLAPSSQETWQIGGALAQALDNAIRDTQREVRAGEYESMEDLARGVGEKAALPALAIAYAYQRAIQAEREEQRERARQAREEAKQVDGGANDGS